MSSVKKWIAGLLVTMTLLTAAVVPVKAYAIDPGIMELLTQMFDWMKNSLLSWMQNAMMSEFQKMQQATVDGINTNANNIFKTQTSWETMGASQGAVSAGMVPYEIATHKNSYQNAQSYIDYTKGSASGSDATRYPVKVINNFNQGYITVKNSNPQCNIDVPQAIGDDSNGCTTQQLVYTNMMLVGVDPVPVYPKVTLTTATGQQYAAENKTEVARNGLAQLALSETTDPQTTAFIKSLQQSFTTPAPAQINSESSEAVARDTLILAQARAMLELRLYESSLMNQRLLATIVAQNEESHRSYIRKLGAAQAAALHG